MSRSMRRRTRRSWGRLPLKVTVLDLQVLTLLHLHLFEDLPVFDFFRGSPLHLALLELMNDIFHLTVLYGVVTKVTNADWTGTYSPLRLRRRRRLWLHIAVVAVIICLVQFSRSYILRAVRPVRDAASRHDVGDGRVQTGIIGAGVALLFNALPPVQDDVLPLCACLNLRLHFHLLLRSPHSLGVDPPELSLGLELARDSDLQLVLLLSGPHGHRMDSADRNPPRLRHARRT
mmetsp:Transcript_27871/g.52792  ORF Transcript_27871/g.52792 Transcript_27871/m.52792 type:complete len:232 (+) Transcript_27871:1873-2568(+)